eukprot:359347-Chlamydomonas_euryale.AAC.2
MPVNGMMCCVAQQTASMRLAELASMHVISNYHAGGDVLNRPSGIGQALLVFPLLKPNQDAESGREEGGLQGMDRDWGERKEKGGRRACEGEPVARRREAVGRP